jgi:hypothetical protein
MLFVQHRIEHAQNVSCYLQRFLKTVVTPFIQPAVATI